MNITAPTPLTRFVNLINGFHRKPVVDWTALMHTLTTEGSANQHGSVKLTRKGDLFTFNDEAVTSGLGLNQMYQGALVPYGTPALYNILCEYYKDGIPAKDLAALKAKKAKA